MKVLGFDCAGQGCAAAVLIDGGVAASRSTPMARGQAEALVPMIETVLTEAGCAAAALDLVAVTIGPGGFTGLRIGIATARGLALAASIPAAGITSFAAIAAAVPPATRGGRPLLVALDSKREEIYLQRFSPEGREIGAPALFAPAAVRDWAGAAPLLLAGDAAARLAPFLAGSVELLPEILVPDPADVARLGLGAWQADPQLGPPRPLYLRAPDTSLPKPRILAR